MGRNGGTAPGNLALRISPTVLQRLRYPNTYIVVTGTNGKTSTTGMIRKIFEQAEYDVASNIYGDNLLRGATTAILSKTSLGGRVLADAVVLESDELTLGKNFEHYKATDIVITNFFRDQLDRCGEMANVVDTVREALSTFDGRVFLNGDDPNLAEFSGVRYGLSKNHFCKIDCQQEKASEARFCPRCSERIVYHYYQYSHIGDYYCPNCEFKRPALDFVSHIFDNEEFEVAGSLFKGSGKGHYHYYNEVAAIAVASTHGIAMDIVQSVLENYETGIGRMEQVGDVLVNLVKNPTGLNQVLDAIYHRNTQTERPCSTLLFVLNNNTVDGVDVSWIWDADIAILATCGVTEIICSGMRAYDMALRFQYEDVGFHIRVIEDLKQAAEELKQNGGYVLSTYSALLETRQYLQ